MPYTFVAERAVVQDTATATNHPFVPTGTLTAGNLAILVFGSAGNITLGASDNAGNTWAVSKQQTNGTSHTICIAWSLLTSNITTSNTVTATTSNAQTAAGGLWEFSGAAASPADQTAGTSGTSTTPTGGTTAALTQADELVIAVFGAGQSAGATVTVSPNAGYSQPSAGEWWLAAGTFQRNINAIYGNVNSTAAVTPGETLTISSGTPAFAGATTTFMAAAVTDPVGNRLRRWRR